MCICFSSLHSYSYKWHELYCIHLVATWYQLLFVLKHTFNSTLLGSNFYSCKLLYIPYMWFIWWWFHFGGLANFYWFAKFKSCHFNLHTQNELIYLPFCQIKMMPILFLNKSPNVQLANKSTYMVRMYMCTYRYIKLSYICMYVHINTKLCTYQYTAAYENTQSKRAMLILDYFLWQQYV